MAEPVWFRDAAEWEAWLEANHAGAEAIVLGLQKKGSSRPGLAYPQAIDAALCYGWIDGVRRSIDAESWCIRFTPRRKRSGWSRVNLAHIERLKRDGRMRPAGLATFDGRDRSRDEPYSFEREDWELTEPHRSRFAAERDAWAWFSAQPLSYRRPASWWVKSAKREETRQRRLDQLIADAAAGRRIASLRRPGKDPA